MQSFIVLGIIPGTDIQTNFNFWLTVALLVASFPLLRRLARKRHAVQAYFIARKIARFIDQYQLPA